MRRTYLNCSEKELEAALIASDKDDTDTAYALFTKLANEGCAEACFQLSLMYEYGLGVEENILISERWHAKYFSLLLANIKQGCQHSLFRLAEMYDFADGLPLDVEKALEIYTQLAEAGYPEAQYVLANRYNHQRPQFYPEETRKYKYWLKKAAESAFPEAMYYYGIMLLREGDKELGWKYIMGGAEGGFWIAQEYAAEFGHMR